MTDIANLSLKVDSTDISEAERELAKLAGTGAVTEKATDGVTDSAKKLSQQNKKTTDSQRKLTAAEEAAERASEELLKTNKKQQEQSKKQHKQNQKTIPQVKMMRGGIQQLGYQIQDVAVQAQMGTNAMVILGQQGPQILSIFGPGGAIAGAIVAIGAAVGGTLFASLMKSKTAVDDLEASMGYLDDTAGLTKDGLFELANELERLAKTNELAARIEAKSGIVGALDAIQASSKLAKEKLEELLSPGFLQSAGGLDTVFDGLIEGQREAFFVMDAFSNDFSAFNAIILEDALKTGKSVDTIRLGYVKLATVVENLKDKYGATTSEATALAGALSRITESSGVNELKTLQRTLDRMANNSGASDKIIKLSSDIRKFTLEAEKAGVKAEGLKEFLSNLGKDLDIGDAEGVEKILSAFDKVEERLKEQVALYGVLSFEAKLRYRIEQGQIEDITEAQKTVLLGLARELDIKRQLTKEAKELAAAEKAAGAKSDREKKAAEAKASRDKKASEAKAAREEAARQTSFEKLQAFLLTEEEAISVSYQRRLDIIINNTEEGSAARLNLTAKLNEKLVEQFAALEEGDTGTFWERYLDSAATALLDVNELAANTVDSLSTGFGDAFERMVFDSESMSDAMRGMAVDMSRSVVNALGRMAAEWLAYQAVQLLVGKTTAASGATALAANAQAMSIMSGINAFSSTAAIPIVGPIAAPGAMAAALAITGPMAATVGGLAVAGAFDEGGIIPSGSVGLVGEIGPELVKGPATVTSRRDTAALLEKNAQNNGETPAPIVNVILDPNDMIAVMASGAGERQGLVFIESNASQIKSMLSM